MHYEQYILRKSIFWHFWQHWQHFWQFRHLLKKLKFLTTLRHWLQFLQMRTWIHDNHDGRFQKTERKKVNGKGGYPPPVNGHFPWLLVPLPDNQEWQGRAFAILAMFEVLVSFPFKNYSRVQLQINSNYICVFVYLYLCIWL